jgi:hypothetical protein
MTMLRASDKPQVPLSFRKAVRLGCMRLSAHRNTEGKRGRGRCHIDARQ